jgi:hypothetical protein
MRNLSFVQLGDRAIAAFMAGRPLAIRSWSASADTSTLKSESDAKRAYNALKVNTTIFV